MHHNTKSMSIWCHTLMSFHAHISSIRTYAGFFLPCTYISFSFFIEIFCIWVFTRWLSMLDGQLFVVDFSKSWDADAWITTYWRKTTESVSIDTKEKLQIPAPNPHSHVSVTVFLLSTKTFSFVVIWIFSKQSCCSVSWFIFISHFAAEMISYNSRWLFPKLL